MWKRLRSLSRALTFRHAFEEGMTDELRFHIEQHTNDLVASGMSVNEATRRAHLEFGNPATIREDCREARQLHIFDYLFRELRQSVRTLRRTPAFTVTALVTLAVCLGANLAIFAVVDAVLLRPLPFPNPDRLTMIYNTYPKAGVLRDGSSLTNYYERRGQIPALSSLSIYREGSSVVGEAGSTESEPMMRVSPEFFTTLGVGPILGREFTEIETSYGHNGAIILSGEWWKNHLNGDPKVLGRQILVNGIPRTVVGVLPPGFRFLSSEARIYLPLSSAPEDRTPANRHSGGNSTHMIGRLASGATMATAQTQIDQHNAARAVGVQEKRMAEAGFRSVVVSLRADHVAAIRDTLLLVQAGVFALLLIGVVNLLNLQLIRAHSRAKEIAVRQALGASRANVIGQVLVESTLLAFAGGVLGLAAGASGIRLLATLGSGHLPLSAAITFDLRIAAAAFAMAMAIGIALALPVAWFSLHTDPAAGIQAETRGGTASRATQWLRHVSVVAQMSLAFILLAGTGLLGLSLKRAMSASAGFRASHLLTGRVLLPMADYADGRVRMNFSDRLLRELRSQPGVVAAGVATNVPLSGDSGKSGVSVKGHSFRPGESPQGHYSYGVGGDYFAAMGMTLKAGRLLTAGDLRRLDRVCVIDEDFAKFYWPNGDALGGHLSPGSTLAPDAAQFTVVGIVAKAKQAALTDDTPQGAVYYPWAYRDDVGLFVVARTTFPPESLALTLQKLVRQIDAKLPVSDIRSMEDRVAESLVVRRAPALLAGLFSAIALLLTGIGTYGVLSYAVAQRRREIGLRMALGAVPGQIRRQFMSLALRLLVCGIIPGLIGAWLTGRAMQAVLFEVPALNPVTLAATAGLMALICLGACLLPSNRAARISPTEALAEQ